MEPLTRSPSSSVPPEAASPPATGEAIGVATVGTDRVTLSATSSPPTADQPSAAVWPPGDGAEHLHDRHRAEHLRERHHDEHRREHRHDEHLGDHDHAKNESAAATWPRPGPVAWVALRTIRGYQRFVSPGLPPACRFFPTCSDYGYEAIAKYGIIRGGRLAAWRLLRCNPFGHGGFDPVA